jgi:transposase InsO family protein
MYRTTETPPCIEHRFIRPSKPMEDALAGSSNGRVRDEFLNHHGLRYVRHARDLSAEWRHDDNQVQPHTALGRLRPKQLSQSSNSPTQTTLRQPAAALRSQARLDLTRGVPHSGP